MSARFETARLKLAQFEMTDADDVFSCITPEITRYLSWEPPSLEAYVARCAVLLDSQAEVQFVIRRRDTGECLGVTAVDRPADEVPELGIWMKTAAHGQGYGREAIEGLLRWASLNTGRVGFLYPVAVENLASRRIAERLGGEVIAMRPGSKYDAVVYRIPARR